MTYDPLWQTVAENPLPGMVRHTPPPVSTAVIGAVSTSTPQNTVGAEGDGSWGGGGGGCAPPPHAQHMVIAVKSASSHELLAHMVVV